MKNLSMDLAVSGHRSNLIKWWTFPLRCRMVSPEDDPGGGGSIPLIIEETSTTGSHEAACISTKSSITEGRKK